jgi:hypothetical protein
MYNALPNDCLVLIPLPYGPTTSGLKFGWEPDKPKNSGTKICQLKLRGTRYVDHQRACRSRALPRSTCEVGRHVF